MSMASLDRDSIRFCQSREVFRNEKLRKFALGLSSTVNSAKTKLMEDVSNV